MGTLNLQTCEPVYWSLMLVNPKCPCLVTTVPSVKHNIITKDISCCKIATEQFGYVCIKQAHNLLHINFSIIQ